MQPGRGHRMAIMSVDGDYTNVALAAVPESDDSTQVGPLVVTGNYCKANTGATNHYNRFLQKNQAFYSLFGALRYTVR